MPCTTHALIVENLQATTTHVVADFIEPLSDNRSRANDESGLDLPQREAAMSPRISNVKRNNTALLLNATYIEHLLLGGAVRTKVGRRASTFAAVEPK